MAESRERRRPNRRYNGSDGWITRAALSAKAMAETLTHFDDEGAARMVDVASKPTTKREAVAAARVLMAAETLQIILSGTATKGDVLGVARLAGIMAAKRTDELIPLCHSLPLSS